MEENLRILSALYGILTPLTELKEYRLDMVNSVFFREVTLWNMEKGNKWLFQKWGFHNKLGIKGVF